jgi:2-oxoglutarate ferredoxin oxidoreductase subunit gamma
MSRKEVVLAGFGGQGIILAGFILGKAAVFNQDNATFTRDYGPEARGGACRADVVISDGEISYPYVEKPTLVVAMSQEAYTKYAANTAEDTLVIIEQELVKLSETANKENILAVPATRIAQELGRAAVANIVMLGFLTAVSGTLPVDAMKKAVLDSVPKGTEELNMKAFDRGYSCGLEVVSSQRWGDV